MLSPGRSGDRVRLLEYQAQRRLAGSECSWLLISSNIFNVLQVVGKKPCPVCIKDINYSHSDLLSGRSSMAYRKQNANLRQLSLNQKQTKYFDLLILFIRHGKMVI